ncbi:endonuclease/exonuclease/phosphatase family protein [Nocardioides ferulae]|uniref:endonuclease/exonuclease/phosphatase family protein n=1 Tax=Nocardioides ferulae TaxID=2340821 RepID=UPI000EAC4FB6|nr:endonuclease/exonuclease/phosphatase family protein [Nocardioides ferulae]
MTKHARRDDDALAKPLTVVGLGALVTALVAVVLVVTFLSPGQLGLSAATRAEGPSWEVPPPADTESGADPSRAAKGGPELSVLSPAPPIEKAGPSRADLARAAERSARRKPPPQPVVPGVDLEPILPTSFRVSSYNVLGASHTTKGGRHAKFTDGVTRMGWAVQLLTGAGISVAGFQEFQPSQHAAFARQAPGWSVFPGPAMGHQALANAIVWREDVWELVDPNTIQIPYFGGRERPMPYVLLRHRETGQTVWFANFHNPADAHGPAQRWRDAAVGRQIALANQLSADGTPVIFTGDFNDREEFFCPMTANTSMRSASGGSVSPCVPARPVKVDWIMGSAPVSFSGYVATEEGLAGRTSDHPFMYAEALVQPIS